MNHDRNQESGWKFCGPLAAVAAQNSADSGPGSLSCSASSSEPGKGTSVAACTQQLQFFTKGPGFVRR